MKNLRLYRHLVNGVLLIIFVLACMICVDGRKLYEFLAVTKVDGLSPAPSSARFDNSFSEVRFLFSVTAVKLNFERRWSL